jgi:hypothetical protein
VLNSSGDQFILNDIEFHSRRDGAMYPKDPSGKSAAAKPDRAPPRALLPVVLLALATVVSAIASLNVAYPRSRATLTPIRPSCSGSSMHMR